MPNPLFVGSGAATAGTATWRLYNLNDDPTERIDLSKRYPARLAALQALFEQEAHDHNLYPLITWEDVQSRIQGAVGAGHSPAR